MADGDDPTRIRSIAVHTDDIVTAYEAARDGQPAVVRVTPPFAGRMRARLHIARERDDPDAIHLPPAVFLAETAPAYPTADETAARLLEGADSYSTEEHHERHRERIDEWRETIRHHLVDRVSLDIPSGSHEVAVKRLG